MTVFLVILMTIGGRDYERREPMPSIEACWMKASNEWNNIKMHPEVEGFGVGCTTSPLGDPV